MRTNGPINRRQARWALLRAVDQLDRTERELIQLDLADGHLLVRTEDAVAYPLDGENHKHDDRPLARLAGLERVAEAARAAIDPCAHCIATTTAPEHYPTAAESSLHNLRGALSALEDAS